MSCIIVCTLEKMYYSIKAANPFSKILLTIVLHAQSYLMLVGVLREFEESAIGLNLYVYTKQLSVSNREMHCVLFGNLNFMFLFSKKLNQFYP